MKENVAFNVNDLIYKLNIEVKTCNKGWIQTPHIIFLTSLLLMYNKSLV